jgi:hypothetical protein
MPLRHAPRALFWLHVLAGLVTISALLLSSPWNIGEGRFSEFIRSFERIDFRWWVLVPVVIVWAVPIAIVLLARQAREAGLQIEQLRELVRKTLEGRQIPIAVDVDARIPVRITQPLRVPVELDTKVPIDEEIEVEAEVPVSVVLPIDTEVETDLLRFGTIKVPIRAEIPIDIVLPVKGVIRARSSGLTVKLREEATVHMPAFEVPVQSRIETRVDLLGSLRAAEEHVRRRLGSGSGSGSE